MLNGEKVGYGRFRIEPDGRGGYWLEAESALRFTFLGFGKHVTLRSRDRVNRDLTLVALDYDYNLDGNRLALRGEVREGLLRVTVANAGRTEERAFALAAPVFPMSALALLPVVRGLEIGSAWRVPVFSGEAQALAYAVQRVEGYESSALLPQPGWKVTTDLLGFGASTWYDAEGRPQLEIAANGIFISYLESETAARRYLADAALNKGELLVDLSVVKVAEPVRSPRTVSAATLAIRTEGRVDLLPRDASQRCEPAAGGVVCATSAAPSPPGPSALGTGLEASLQVPHADPAIRRLAAEIGGALATDAAKADAIVAWIRENVTKEAADAFSALDVLAARRAECQGHAWLYAALARALGIPTRVVNGLAYSQEWGGFLYHTWNESLIDGAWIAVDPTFGQRPADALRLKIVYGEGGLELLTIADWVGRTRIDVLDYR